MRDRAWRNCQRERKITKRKRYVSAEGVKEAHLGVLDKNHFGCGCFMCKPWKHQAYGEPRFKHSEMVRLLEKEEHGN